MDRSISNESLQVNCSRCGAKANRKCIRLVGLEKGTVLRETHPARQKAYLKWELEKLFIEGKELVSGLPVRHHKTRQFGYVEHVNDDKFWVEWESGKITSHDKDNPKNILNVQHTEN